MRQQENKRKREETTETGDERETNQTAHHLPYSMMETEPQTQSPMKTDHWNQSIQRNNQGISAFLQGNLIVAHRLFAEASVLQRMAFDDDERDGLKPYRCKWVSIQPSAFSNSNPSHTQMRNMSHVFMFFLRIQEEEEKTERRDKLPRVAPDVFLANVHWAVDFNLALTSQLLGILFHNNDLHEAMYFRALSFDTYEQIERDVVDWFDDDGFAPLAVAIFIMAIYNNQGAMFCQLQVPTQMEEYWGRMRKIWNRASILLLRKALVCSLFQGNLRYLEAKETQAAGAA